MYTHLAISVSFCMFVVLLFNGKMSHGLNLNFPQAGEQNVYYIKTIIHIHQSRRKNNSHTPQKLLSKHSDWSRQDPQSSHTSQCTLGSGMMKPMHSNYFRIADYWQGVDGNRLVNCRTASKAQWWFRSYFWWEYNKWNATVIYISYVIILHINYVINKGKE